jgi:hypothetical protein
MWKMFRATVVVALWGGVSLVLASSMFLDKLPHNIGRGDLQKIQGFISDESVSRIISQLEGLSSRGLNALGILRVAGLAEQQESEFDKAKPLDV